MRVLAVQVGSLCVRSDPMVMRGKQRAIDIARGKVSPVPQEIDGDIFPRLAGTPHLARFQYNTIAEVGKLKVPALMIDAGNEELFDVRENCGKAFEILRSKATIPVRYKVIDGIDHYGIYFGGFDEGSEAALEWFNNYL